MASQVPVREQFPDLFAALNTEQAFRAEQILANQRLEGADHDAAEVSDLVDLVSERISRDEYMQRGRTRIEARHRAGPPTL